jgi:GNAT superfamily N-acetyltransferase
MEIATKPLTPATWNDFIELFGAKGACGGCWCMNWRLMKGEFDAGKGDQNRDRMKELVDSGSVPGLIAYIDKKPIGWISLSPRKEYIRLTKSRIFAPIDELDGVWSISCLFFAKPFQRRGLSSLLITEAVKHAQANGAKVVEAYPHDMGSGKSLPAPFVWTGITSSYIKAGFKEAARRSKTRPIIRYYL